jgi:hypothetical protein
MIEVFAIGSLIYAIITEEAPYSELVDDVVEAHFNQGIFPSTTNACLGEVLVKCWVGGFNDVQEIFGAVNAVSSSLGGQETSQALSFYRDSRVLFFGSLPFACRARTIVQARRQALLSLGTELLQPLKSLRFKSLLYWK